MLASSRDGNGMMAAALWKGPGRQRAGAGGVSVALGSRAGAPRLSPATLCPSQHGSGCRTGTVSSRGCR